MRLPSPPAPLAAAVVRAALALPDPVRRRLAGRPVEHDGQRLDVEAQLLLRLSALDPAPPPWSASLDRARAGLRAQAAVIGGRQPIGAVRALRAADRPARLYVPRREERAPDPLLVFFHGGGFVLGDLESHDAVCRVLAERAGVRVLSVDYRLAPEHPFPAAAEDAEAALQWAHAHAEELGADPARIAVGGDSAGGNLATVAALAAARAGVPVALQVLVYPVTDATGSCASRRLADEDLFLTRGFIDLADRSYTPDPAARADPRCSPLLGDVPPGLAPAYVATAGLDPLRDEGEAWADRMREAGVPVTLRRFEGQIHSFFNLVGAGREARRCVEEIADAVRDGLAGPP